MKEIVGIHRAGYIYQPELDQVREKVARSLRIQIRKSWVAQNQRLGDNALNSGITLAGEPICQS